MSARSLEHPGFARLYSRVSRWLDVHGGDAYRTRLLSPLSGRVVEIGAGNGLNFAHYPSTVNQVLAIEPESRLRAEAVRAAAGSRVPVHVVSGRAEQLPLPDGGVDGAVLSLVLCSIEDRAAALAEIRRSLRPGGIVRFYEHVRSAQPVVARFQDGFAPVWKRLAGGCRFNQDAVAVLRAAGFVIADLDRFPFAGATHVLGTASAGQPH